MRRAALSLIAATALVLSGCGGDDEPAAGTTEAPSQDAAVDPVDEGAAEEPGDGAVDDAPEPESDGAGDGIFADVTELCAFVQENLDAIGAAAQLGEIEPEVGPVIGRDCAAKNDDFATYAAITLAFTFAGDGIPGVVEGYTASNFTQEPAPSVTDDAVLALDPGEFGTEQHHVVFSYEGQIFDVYVENPGEAGFGPTDPQLVLDTAALFVELFASR
jgi:hypothetical protein